jgi:ABC-type branched-subunit amino acid transport system substrate-binding protein
MKVLFISFFLLTIFVHAQPNTSARGTEVYFNQLAEEYFLLGMRQYSQKDFKPALQSFQRSISSYPLNHRITASLIMSAKTYYALKNFEQAEALCDSFLIQFPSSEYVEDALFTKGMCHYNLGNYVTTIIVMDSVLSIARQSRNLEHSIKVIRHIAFEFLTKSDIDSVCQNVNNISVLSLLHVNQAELLFSMGRKDEAKSLLDSIKSETLDTLSLLRLKGLYARIEHGNIVKVGVLLPLSNQSASAVRDKRIAQDVLEGIQLALGEYDETLTREEVNIELVIRDSKRNADIIDSIMFSFKNDSTILAVIGPVFSDETISAAIAAQREGLPLISPTATDDSISLAGNYVFQTNSTPSMRGKILAQYAVKDLNAKNIAILASDASFSKVQADSFAAEIVRLGGNIVIDRRYRRGATDLREHIRAIRVLAAELQPEYHVILKGKINTADVKSKLISFGLKKFTVDSLLSKSDTINLSAFVGDKAQELVDSLKLPYKKVLPFIDSLHYPVSSIDVVFSPISISQQIGVVSSQIAYYNIKTILLGSADWYNTSELDMNRRYANGVIFGSDKWIEQNSRTKSLYTRYSQRFNKQISDQVLFGYDVMTLVIKLFNDGALSREQLIAVLSGVVNFSGVRNSITLTQGRINSDFQILQYKDGAVSKLRTYTYQP